MRIATPPDGMRLVKVDVWGGAIFRGAADRNERRTRLLPTAPQIKPKVPWQFLCDKWLSDGFDMMPTLADELGVSANSLIALYVGWSERHKSWTFPMRDATGKITGVRLRRPDGSKWAVKGSSEGLFYCPVKKSGTVYVVEGASDCAALMSLNLHAVGKPSALGCSQMLCTMLLARDVVIVADRDKAGARGAEETAEALKPVASRVRIVIPSVGKDVRDWVRRGATARNIEEACT